MSPDIQELILAAKTLCDQVANEVAGAHSWPAAIYLRAAAGKVERSSDQPTAERDPPTTKERVMASKAEEDLWAALNEVLPAALNPDSVTSLRDAISGLVDAKIEAQKALD